MHDISSPVVSDKACIFRVSGLNGWGDIMGGIYTMFEACTANRRGFLMDGPDHILNRYFVPREYMWSLVPQPPLTGISGAVQPPLAEIVLSNETYSISNNDNSAYERIVARFDSEKKKIKHRLWYHRHLMGDVGRIGADFPFMETDRLTTIWAVQATVSRVTGFMGQLEAPIVIAFSEKGQALPSRLFRGEISWSSVRRQADIWFRLLSPTDFLRTQLERTICRTFFLTDHLDPTWKPDTAHSIYPQALERVIRNWSSVQRLQVMTPICTGLSEVLRLSPWTSSVQEGLSLSEALLKVFRLSAEALIPEKESRLQFDILRNHMVPILESGFFAVHYRTGDRVAKLHQRNDKRNEPTPEGTQRCIDMAPGLGLFMSDHAKLREKMLVNDRLIPLSVPEYKLLHNAAHKGRKLQDAWDSLLTEWLLLIQMDQIVVTNSGFGGSAAMFLDHSKVHICQKGFE